MLVRSGDRWVCGGKSDLGKGPEGDAADPRRGRVGAEWGSEGNKGSKGKWASGEVEKWEEGDGDGERRMRNWERGMGIGGWGVGKWGSGGVGE